MSLIPPHWDGVVVAPGSTLIIRIVKGELFRDFDGVEKMAPFAVINWVSAKTAKRELVRTRTDWNSHMHPVWHQTCPTQLYAGAGSGDRLEVNVFEDNRMMSATFCGVARIFIDDLLAVVTPEDFPVDGREVAGPMQEMELELAGEVTGNVTVRALLVANARSHAFNAESLTAVDTEMFHSPVKRLGVSGGTAPFFKLALQEERLSGRPFDYFIGKDLSRAADEITFYEGAQQIIRNGSDADGLAALLGHMFEYAGVFTCVAEGEEDEGSKQLLVLRNLFSGGGVPRLLDLKIGQRTASGGWCGKSHVGAAQQDVVDEFTNSSSEGFRLEGFDGPPPSLVSMNPLMDFPGTKGEKAKRKAFRMMLQRMTGQEVLMHFLDTHQEPSEPSASAEEFLSAAEFTEVILRHIVKSLLDVSLTCRRVHVPQKWIGSSLALGFNSGKLPRRDVPEEEIVKSVQVNLFDWGRSLLNTFDIHEKLSAAEQHDRVEFWGHYTHGIDRMAWESARCYWNRFANAREWDQCILAVWDFDSHKENDFIGTVKLSPIEETSQKTVVLKDEAGFPLKGKPTLTFSVQFQAFPSQSRFRGAWRINIIKAERLPVCDIKTGTSDPFVEVITASRGGSHCFRQLTEVKPGTLNPEWNETLEVPVARQADVLEGVLRGASEVIVEEPIDTMLPCQASIVESLMVPVVIGKPGDDEGFSDWRSRLDNAVYSSTTASREKRASTSHPTGEQTSRSISIIEQGPKGVRICAQLAGFLGLVMSGLLVANPFTGGLDPSASLLDTSNTNSMAVGSFQVACGLCLYVASGSLMIFEMRPSGPCSLELVPCLLRLQNHLLKHAGCFCTAFGRCGAYILIGCFWILVPMAGEWYKYIVSVWLWFVAALYVAVWRGYLPRYKVRRRHKGGRGHYRATLKKSIMISSLAQLNINVGDGVELTSFSEIERLAAPANR